MLDQKLNLWLIECNAIPAMSGTTPEKEDLMNQMLKDMFEIQYAYLRSRIKRTHEFINGTANPLFEYENKLSKGEKAQKPVIDWKTLKKQFAKINKNYLEPEYKISKENSFSLVFDENLEGKNAYFGNIDDTCF